MRITTFDCHWKSMRFWMVTIKWADKISSCSVYNTFLSVMKSIIRAFDVYEALYPYKQNRQWSNMMHKMIACVGQAIQYKLFGAS